MESLLDVVRHRAPPTLAQCLEIATIKEDASFPPANEMVSRLAADHEHLVTASNRAAKAAEQEGDDITANLLEDIRDDQDKDLRMLRAFLK